MHFAWGAILKEIMYYVRANTVIARHIRCIFQQMFPTGAKDYLLKHIDGPNFTHTKYVREKGAHTHTHFEFLTGKKKLSRP